MTVFFDKANLEALLRAHGQTGQAETLKMLRSEVDVAVNFSMQDALAPGPSRDVLSKFVGQMAVGQKQTSFRFRPHSYPDRPIAPAFQALPQAPRRSVVLADDPNLPACASEGTSMMGAVGEELPALSRLHRGDKYKFSTPLTIGTGRGQFANWTQLAPHVLPFHDLIIHDRYLLKNREVFTHNYRGLLQALAQGRHGRLNVVLLTLLPDEAAAGPEYEWLRELTLDILTPITGQPPFFTVVWGERTADVGHDRHIITNYQWLSSGDSFLYFWPNGQLRSHGDTLTVHSLADAETRTHADELLNRMQNTINELLLLPSLVQGDRISSFLTF